MYLAPFEPSPAASIQIAATATGSSTALPVIPINAPIQYVLTNLGSSSVFVAVGTSATTCTAVTGYPIPASSHRVITVNLGKTAIYAICATGQSTTLSCTPGNGS